MGRSASCAQFGIGLPGVFRPGLGRAGGPERAGTSLAVDPQHLAELLPRRRLVVAGGDVEDVVEAAQARRAADLRPPGVAAVAADVAVARVPCGQTLVDDGAVEVPSRCRTRTACPASCTARRRSRSDADLAVAVLHPVGVERLAAVVLVRLGVVVVHPVRTSSCGTGVQPGCGLPNGCVPGACVIRNGWSGKSRRIDRRLVLVLAALAGRGGVPRGRPDRGVGVPGQLRLVDPVLRVDRLEQRVVLHVGRDVGGRRRRERRAQHERREHGDRPDPRALPHRGHLHLALPLRRRAAAPWARFLPNRPTGRGNRIAPAIDGPAPLSDLNTARRT